LVAGKGFPPIGPTILILFSFFFGVTAVSIYNEIQDAEINDDGNIKKKKRIASGKVKAEDAQLLAYFFGVIGLSFAWMANIYIFSFTLVYFILYYVYLNPQFNIRNRFLTRELNDLKK
jgi:4-hydroxybenzoate polyprenyltransferase